MAFVSQAKNQAEILVNSPDVVAWPEHTSMNFNRSNNRTSGALQPTPGEPHLLLLSCRVRGSCHDLDFSAS